MQFTQKNPQKEAVTNILRVVAEMVHDKELVNSINYLKKPTILPQIGIPQQEDNIDRAIYQKCIRLKNRNKELVINILDLKKKLVKSREHQKNYEKERIYTECLKDIEDVSIDVRRKVEKCYLLKKQKQKTINNRDFKNKEEKGKIIQGLKESTQELARDLVQKKQQLRQFQKYLDRR